MDVDVDFGVEGRKRDAIDITKRNLFKVSVHSKEAKGRWELTYEEERKNQQNLPDRIEKYRLGYRSIYKGGSLSPSAVCRLAGVLAVVVVHAQ